MIGILNSDMFGADSVPGEHVDWSKPDLLTRAEWRDLLGVDVETYADQSPHMIVFDISPERQPRPIGPQREGIYIQDAPGLFHGWQRKCATCGCSVGADHVAGSEDCLFLIEERRWKVASDPW